MNLKNNTTFAGIILLVIWISIMLYIGRDIQADLTGDSGYEPAKGIGHPLYQDY